MCTVIYTLVMCSCRAPVCELYHENMSIEQTSLFVKYNYQNHVLCPIEALGNLLIVAHSWCFSFEYNNIDTKWGRPS